MSDSNNQSERPTIGAFNLNFMRISSGFMGMMTPYGWMEGRSEDIGRRIRKAREEEERQKDMSNPYNHDMEMSSDSEVNGFALRDVSRPMMPESLFNKLVELWKSESGVGARNGLGYWNNYLEFEDKCQDAMCSDWCKQDEYGGCFEGYWKYPEDSYEKENAFNLSQKMNIYRLYKLPYPLKVLLETIELGCGNRQESVAYSNFLCEWVRRKYYQMHPNLEQLPLREPKDVSPPHSKGSQDWKNLLENDGSGSDGSESGGSDEKDV